MLHMAPFFHMCFTCISHAFHAHFTCLLLVVIDDVRSDYNIQKADVNIFVETKLCLSDRDDTYSLGGFTLYRNDFNQSHIRTCYGTAVYIKNDLTCIEIPDRFNFNNVEMTVTVWL